MKFSEQWLRQWVQPAIDSDQLISQLSLAGLEVDAVMPAAPQNQGVICARIEALKPHGKKSGLTVCTIDDGNGKKQVISAAQNLLQGKVALYAPPGAVLQGKKIGSKSFDGSESAGMLCSAQDLGLEDTSSGIYLVDDGCAAGTPLAQALGLDDTIIELDLTPNRSDCLSIRGIAREVGVLNDAAVNQPQINAVAPQSDRRIAIRIEATEGCPRYVGRVIESINPKVASPVWLIERLRRSGIRSLGPVVDVTNYVMLELGQPMHAFDYDKVSGAIVVRQAVKGEKLALLNGQTCEIQAGTLLIADEQKPLALAGIMGGQDSAVTDDTRNIVLESAYFTPTTIAGKPRRYGLHTDSSHRFERGVDYALQVLAMERATQLLLDIVGGSPGPVIEIAHQATLPQAKPINLRFSRVRRVLGSAPDNQQIQSLLQGLGMTVDYDASKESWQVTPPSFRPDIEIEEDLIEEIARVNGYDNIQPTAPLTAMSIKPASEQKVDSHRVSALLTDRGYSETINYSFVEGKLQQLLNFDASFDVVAEKQPLQLANPLSEEMNVLRTNLLPGLVRSLLHNLRRQQNRVRLFEIGLIYLGQQADINQRKQVGILAAGDVFPEQWQGFNRETDFFQFKGDIEALLGLTGRSGEFIFSNITNDVLHPGQSAQIELGGEAVGWLGSLNPQILTVLEVPVQVMVAQLDWAVFQHCRVPQFQEVTKFPGSRRDLAFLMDEGISAGEVAREIRQAAGQYLQSLRLFDVYRGKGVASGKKSHAYALVLHHVERTLTDKEVEETINNVVSHLADKFNITLRE